MRAAASRPLSTKEARALASATLEAVIGTGAILLASAAEEAEEEEAPTGDADADSEVAVALAIDALHRAVTDALAPPPFRAPPRADSSPLDLHAQLDRVLSAVAACDRTAACPRDPRAASSPLKDDRRALLKFELGVAVREAVAIALRNVMHAAACPADPKVRAIARFTDDLQSGRLPDWALSLMGTATARNDVTEAEARHDALLQMAPILGQAMQALLWPLAGSAANDPKPGLHALATLASLPGGPGALAAIFRAERGDGRMQLHARQMQGRQMESSSALACLFRIGRPAVLGAELGAASAQPREKTSNLDRLIEVGDSDIMFTVDGLKRGLGTLHTTVHQILKRAVTSDADARADVLAWFATLLNASAPKADAISSSFRIMMRPGDEHRKRMKLIREAASDECLTNIWAVLLRFCGPFLKLSDTGEVPLETLCKLDPRLCYARPPGQGRIEYTGRHTTLAGRIARTAAMQQGLGGDFFDDVAEAEEAEEASRSGAAAALPVAAAPEGSGPSPAQGEGSRGSLSFVGEIFFLTQYAMHLGPVPTYRHCRFQSDAFAQNVLAQGGDGNGGLTRSQHNTLYRMHQAFTLHLHQPETLSLSLSFIRLSVAWLRRLAELPPPQAAAALELVPSFVVGDLCVLLVAAAQYESSALSVLHLRPLALDFAALLRAGCPLLNSGVRLIRSPIVLGQIVDVFYHLVLPDNARRRHGSNTLLGGMGWGGDVAGRLSDAVLGDKAVREGLILPLAATYSAIDAVEGLDVDAVENEGADGGGFEKFSLRERINTLLQHLWRLPDSRAALCRAASTEQGSMVVRGLANGMLDSLLYQLEEALKRIREANRAEWSSSPQELKHSQDYCKALLHGSMSNLQLMQALAEEAPLARVFASMPVAPRTAAASVQFLNLLCGKKAAENLKLRERFTNEDFGFDPQGLLRGLCVMLVRTARHSEDLVSALAANPDVEADVLAKVVKIVTREHIINSKEGEQLAELFEMVALQCNGRPATSGSGASGSEAAGDGAGGAGVSGSSDEAEIWDVLRRELGDGTVDGAEDTALAGSYAEAMGDHVFDSAEMLADDCSQAHFYKGQATASASSGVLPALRKKLMREIKDMQGGSLPLHLNAAIYVRQEETRMDTWRALLSGPVDTPYALGLFTFDVFCPPEYPAIAPLVHFETTGGGTVKFNPNLYADGKVCLSLLGTFNAGDASEKWDPVRSSLFQVFVSIQSQIFTEQPIVNEPGYDERQSSSAASKEYNAKLRLQTIRHAMIGPLQNPPVGFEDAVVAHFRSARGAVLRLCREWTREAPEDMRGKMEKALGQLHAVLPAAADS